MKHEGRQISLAFSPCPNDTFMMDAWVNTKINTSLEPQVQFLDIEQLNQAALNRQYDVTKISAATYPLVAEEYDILDAGSAMGFGSGPLLVARPEFDPACLNESAIALPGQHTTAHYLFQRFYPAAEKKKFMLFSEIESAISDGRVGAGVIIHESRFTYDQKGLVLLADLGVLWEKTYALPLPLGIMVCRKSFPDRLKYGINHAIRDSIQFAFDHRHSSRDFVLRHAQEMDPEVVEKHIQLYVNTYSLSMGREGRQAINFLILPLETKNKLV